MSKQSQGWEEGGAGGTAAFPRYARVNTLKISLAEARSQLISSPPFSLPTSSSSRVSFTADEIKDDEHIPNLLLFPPGSDLHDHPLVKSGALILQDKASCFPAHVLLGKEGGKEGGREDWWVGDVIDACAAPGNKTSHAAALLQEHARAAAAASAACQDVGSAPIAASVSSVVYALDRDGHRLDILKERVIGLMGAKGRLVVPLLQDFLSINPQQQQQQPPEGRGRGTKKGRKGVAGLEGGREGGVEGRFREVRAIMLDPSCSGSGMVKSMERRLEEEEEEVEVEKGEERKRGGRKEWTYRDWDGGVKGGKEGEKEGEAVEEEERKSTKAVIKDGGATQRLRALSQFQFKALVKALVDFPAVNRVVYSTCSIHVEENEMVVAAALKSQRKAYGEGAADKEGKEGGGVMEGSGKEGEKKRQTQEQKQQLAPFELVRALPSWPRRGLSRTLEGRETGLSEEEANCLVRTDPRHDLTNGFFVAYFEREGTGGAGKKLRLSNVKGGGRKVIKGTAETVAVVPTVVGTKRPREGGERTEQGGDRSGGGRVSSKQNKSAKRRERRKKQKRLAGGGGGEGDGEAGGGEVQKTAE